MKLRGRVMKLERTSIDVVRPPGTREDAVLWTRRFRAADAANEKVYQDICAYGHSHHTDYFYKGRTDETHAAECFKAIYFPIEHAVDRDSEPHCDRFSQTPDMLRRLVNGLWQYQQESGGQFPLEYHHIDQLAGANGDGLRELWCFYADLAELWMLDRKHPTVLGWRRRLVEDGQEL